MRAAVIGVVLVLVAGGSASAQGTQESPRTPLMLEVAARGYLVGGRMGSMAGDSAVDRLESYVWADQTLCGMGAGDQAPANTPWTGWHFTGTVLVDAPGEMTVRIEWQRIWENGARVQNGPSDSQTFRLRNGERVELDRIAPTTVGRCGTIEAKLEAAVMARAPYLVGVPGGVASGVGGGVATGARGGRGGAGRGGVSAGSGSGTGGGVAGAGARGGVSRGVGSGTGTGAMSGTGVAGSRGRGATTPESVASAAQTLKLNAMLRMSLAGAYDAEIWLVHRRPDGTEDVQQQTVRFGTISRAFSFPPVQVPGSAGAITLDITGSLQLLGASGGRGYFGTGYTVKSARGAAGGRGVSTPEPVTTVEPSPTPLFVVSIARRARRATPFIDTRGTTDLSIQIPKPEDVFSFELPPLQKATEDLLKGHTFSIRLRMTGVK